MSETIHSILKKTSGIPLFPDSMKRPLFIIAFLLLAGVCGAVAVRVAETRLARGQAVSVPETPVADPRVLIDDLDARLAHLQGRVQNVGFHIHRVGPREHLWRLAARKPYSVHTLIGCNPQLETYEVNIGQRVMLPSKGGTLYRIREHDTWESIAQAYDVPADELRRVNAGAGSLRPGELLFVAGRRPLIEFMNENMREKYEMRALFVSPLGGRLSSLFGRRKHPVTGRRSFHGGIDIAVPSNTPVSAAADGVVTVAGSGVGHYGTAVFIDHGNGYVTHYGHLSRVSVRPGQRVREYQIVGRSGATGRVTGPHLHFTIKKNGESKDPLKYIW